MKEFEVTVQQTFVTSIIVEAESVEDAREQGRSLRYDTPRYENMIESSTEVREV